MNNNGNLLREIYDAFQRGELDRWDAVVSPDVVTTSPASYGEIHGLAPLKGWANEFVTSLAPRIDLIDEFDGGARIHYRLLKLETCEAVLWHRGDRKGGHIY